ncbi:class I SAM-dependent methyltransferase [Streptomyces antimicrobicus]|uniref:Class I SAM-dependent methyltransferase n=1 Tax=Streptomyces antimicrobicus TaxID=2883108 RepID=A0ABS8BAR5_9ACTN|nr:class I SAM-dependent methyltransferase [Streptomyces antimicrobicus]MCB5181714.1 class I SAM-dependent methyltransferase [Streptomyces antimicrobicus]
MHERSRGSATPPRDPDGGAWSGPEGARAFAAVEAATDWLLGYPFVFRHLARRIGEGDVLVDYGCGPGTVADAAARRLGARVLGVDTSPEMLELARRAGTAVAEFHLVEHGRATGLPDGCADAVMCNHVLASVPTQEGLLAVFTEVRRLLRPGGPFVLLTTDPACAGPEYASLRIGGPGPGPTPGEEFTVRLLRRDGSWQEVRNHAWPVELFAGLLHDTGFHDVTQHRPTVDEAEEVADPDVVRSRDWEAERRRPPLVVTTAVAH